MLRPMRLHATVLIAAIATLFAFPIAASAQLKVLMSGGFSGPYERLLPEFERSTGVKVSTASGASQGTGPQTIRAQLAAGAQADVVILSSEGLADLAAAGRIATGTETDLAQTPLGIAVRAGSPKIDVGTVESFKRVVTSAKSVSAPGSTSGIFVRDHVLPRLGIADQVRLKTTPRGAEAAAMVASGEAELAIMPISEIVHAPGVEVGGILAEEIQLHQVFAAAVVAGSSQLDAAKRLIAFLASDAAAAAIRSGGMEPVRARRP
jgi:molybdate transport system substrate-binding protein